MGQLTQNSSDQVVVREIRKEDATEFLALCHTLDAETTFMLLESGERKTSIAEQEDIIDRMNTLPNQMMLVAVHCGEFIGFIVAIGGAFSRNKHCVSLVIGIKRAWWRMGIGGRLIDAAEQWATQNQVHRLELTVRADNQRAIALYESKGFSIEGKKRDALYVNDAYVDEFYMGKLLATASS